MAKYGLGTNFFIGYLASSLAEGGSETIIYLSDLKTLTGESIVTADFATLGYGELTIDPLSTTDIESITFTGVDASAVSLTGATRGLSAVGSDTSADRKPYHPVGTMVIITFGTHNIKGLKDYIDSQIAALTVGVAGVVTTGVAGETVAAGNLIYLKAADNRWWLTDADTLATLDATVEIGIAQGSGTAGNAITGGVLLRGTDTHQSGLTGGTLYYVSNTAGALSATAGTNSRAIGIAKSATDFILDKDLGVLINLSNKISEAISESTGSSDANKLIKTKSDGLLDYSLFGLTFGDGSDGDVTISSPTTLTRDMYYDNLTINSTLTTNGYRVYVKDTIDGSGTIDWGTPNNGGNGGLYITRGLGGVQSGAGVMKNASGGSGLGDTGTVTPQITGQLGLAGKTGGKGQGTAAGGQAGTSPTLDGKLTLYTLLNLCVLGCYQKSDGTFGFLTPCSAGGGGRPSTGGTTSQIGGGGGAGASGGVILICAKIWNGTFTIKSIGGNGGNGAAGNDGDGGGGAGGNGGCPIIVYFKKLWSGSYLLTGGTGGTNGGGSGEAGPNGETGTYYEIDAGLLK